MGANLYRPKTAADVLEMIAKAKAGVTQKPGVDSVTPGVTQRIEEGIANLGNPDTSDIDPALLAAVETALGEKPAPSPAAKRRSKDRHKPSQAEYMRAYRARKKAEGGAGRGT